MGISGIISVSLIYIGMQEFFYESPTWVCIVFGVTSIVTIMYFMTRDKFPETRLERIERLEKTNSDLLQVIDYKDREIEKLQGNIFDLLSKIDGQK